jgi:CheY-like chemotaxis protein
VLIVDDNALIRQALCELFTREGDFEISGEADNGREAIEKAQFLAAIETETKTKKKDMISGPRCVCIQDAALRLACVLEIANIMGEAIQGMVPAPVKARLQ